MKRDSTIFGSPYTVMPGICIDHRGISDGTRHFPWHEVRACAIGPGEGSSTIFGDDDNEPQPYVLSLTRHDGSKHGISLDGIGEEKARHLGKAINHFSGRRLITIGYEGKTFIWGIVIAVVATALIIIMAIS